jgi:5-carboxymethyl-2-hydroxymuconate isomerase
MAHFILEYSANLDSAALALNPLFEKLHQAAVDTGLFPLGGIRSRAHRCEHFRVADGNPAYSFVHLQVKIGAGRTEEEKQAAAKSFFSVLSEHLNTLYEQQGMAISLEMTELPVALKYNQNNLRDYLAKP